MMGATRQPLRAWEVLLGLALLGDVLLTLNSILLKLTVAGVIPTANLLGALWTLAIALLGGHILWRSSRWAAWILAGQALFRLACTLYLERTSTVRWGVLAPGTLMHCYVAILELAAARYALKASRLRWSRNA